MKKPMLSQLVIALGFVPLAIKLPYMLRAWRISPLDRFDWIFGVLFAAAVAVAARKVIERREKPDAAALAALLPFFGLFVLSFAVSTNALGIAAGIAFSGATVWLAWGWRSAYTILPAYGILMLMCTSSTYWLTYFFKVDGLAAKAVLTILFGIWQAINIKWEHRVPREKFCFAAAATLAALMIWQTAASPAQTPAFLPGFAAGSFGNYLGREQEITDADRRFFGDSNIERYYFVSDSGAVNVLALDCGQNINQVHPASHCLRSSGWSILSEQLKEVSLHDHHLMLSEIVAVNEHSTLLVWVWYSNRRFSTGSFIDFRRSWRQQPDWYTYQISTPLDRNIEVSRRRLSDFLQSIPDRSPPDGGR
jgi:hypothetical protein